MMAVMAAGALVSACGGAPAPDAVEGAQAGGAQGQGAVAADAGAAADAGTDAVAEGAARDGDRDSQGKSAEHRHDADRGNGGHRADGSGEAAPVDLPADWEGTISTQALPVSGGTQYLLMNYLYGAQQTSTSLTGDEVAGQEFFAGQQVECEGVASLAGSSASCLLTDGSQELPLEARLVPTAFGHSALLLSVDEDGLTDLSIPQDAPLAFWGTEVAELEDVTAADVEGAAFSAVLMADRPDGDVPPEITIDCTMLDGGAHATCEVAGTPDGGGDGTWYATAQPGYRPGVSYVFSQLPA